jgi:glucose-6-phosphate isomerase
MSAYLLPFSKTINLKDGTIPDAPFVVTRRISNMQGLYADAAAEVALLAENPIVYEVFEATENPAVVGQLRYSTTVIRPGKVGDEYFMTKGHYHAMGDRVELYYGLLGEGYLLLQTPEGEVNIQPMKPGVLAFVPPYWGHRTLNVGVENFVFLAVYPADAGYDYKTIEDQGFAAIVVERDGQPQVVPNPRYKGG